VQGGKFSEYGFDAIELLAEYRLLSKAAQRLAPARSAAPHSFSLPCGMRIDNDEIFAMAQSGTHQRLEPSAGLELIEQAQGPKDLLAYLLTLADAMDDLEILVGTGTFDSKKHCSALLALQ